jgi:hypothetical protein
MALKMNLPKEENKIFMDFPEAYVRVTEVDFESRTGRARIKIQIFANQVSRDEIDSRRSLAMTYNEEINKPDSTYTRKQLEQMAEESKKSIYPVADDEIECDLTDLDLAGNDLTETNLVAAAYEYIKTLPKYSSGTDV